MAATLVNLTGYNFAIVYDETGINIQKFTHKYSSKKLYLPDKTGFTRGKVFWDFSIAVSIEGEVAGASGLRAATIGASIAMANLIYGFGITSGGVYVEDATLENDREKLQTLSISAMVHPQVA